MVRDTDVKILMFSGIERVWNRPMIEVAVFVSTFFVCCACVGRFSEQVFDVGDTGFGPMCT